MTGRTLTVFAFTTVATCVLAANPAPHGDRLDRAPVRAPHAMVASGHELASQAGVEAMRQGGNAVDAAVATGFALAVVLPEAGNLGGGGFMLLRLADGHAHFLDFREKAPAAATRDMYLDAKGNLLPDASVVGYRAIGVPGSVAGLVYAEKKFGKLTLAQAMAPAIRLARQGFALSAHDARQLRDPSLAAFPETRRIFQRDGHYYQPGRHLQAAGTGAHAGAHRRRSRQFLPRRAGAGAGGFHSRRAAASSRPRTWRPMK